MTISISGAILCGGLATRFSGRPKGLITIGGKAFVDILHCRLAERFPSVLLVTNEPLMYADRDIRTVTDVFSARSALTGIHTALFYAETEFVFVSACDTPFLSVDMIDTVIRSADPNADAVLPRTGKGFEPLCALYSVRCRRF